MGQAPVVNPGSSGLSHGRLRRLRGQSHSTGDAIGQRTNITEEQFLIIYEATSRALWAYLVRATGDREAANDLLQEAFSRFLSANAPEMNPADSKSYLFRIATNLLRDRWRRRESSTTAENLQEPGEDGLEQRLEVRRAFQQLKPRERQLLWLAHVEGFSHEEIAEVSGLRAGSIRLLLFRARRKLADILRKPLGSSE